jgi:predicted Zn-dependent protease
MVWRTRRPRADTRAGRWDDTPEATSETFSTSTKVKKNVARDDDFTFGVFTSHGRAFDHVSQALSRSLRVCAGEGAPQRRRRERRESHRRGDEDIAMSSEGVFFFFSPRRFLSRGEKKTDAFLERVKERKEA